MSISISGNFNVKDIEKNINRYFSIKNKNFDYQTISNFRSTQDNIRSIIIPRKTAQTTLAIAFPCFEERNEDSYALGIACIILGDGMSSRLFSMVREKYGLVYSINSELSLYKSGGYLSINAGLDRKNLDSALNIIFKELNKILKKGFTKEELQKAKV